MIASIGLADTHPRFTVITHCATSRLPFPSWDSLHQTKGTVLPLRSGSKSIGFNLGQSMTFFCEVVACYRDLSDVQLGYWPNLSAFWSWAKQVADYELCFGSNVTFSCLDISGKSAHTPGTRLFTAHSAGSDNHHELQKANLIIKDFWAPATSHDGEVDLLKAAGRAAVRGIVKLSGMEVTMAEKKDVTATNPDSYSRILMWITKVSVGVPIWDVVSGEEGGTCLSKEIRDAIASHCEFRKIAGQLFCLGPQPRQRWYSHSSKIDGEILTK